MLARSSLELGNINGFCKNIYIMDTIISPGLNFAIVICSMRELVFC